MGNNIVSIKQSKILVVDDKQENLELLTNLLESEGFEIAYATSGEQAIQIAALFLPQLILLDVMMPGIDGFETCRRLKSLKEVKDIPVIFVTGKAEISDVIEAFTVGGVDYITKPIRHEEVVARVTTHLQLQALISLRDELISALREQNIELENLARLKDEQLEKSEQFNHIGELVGELTHEIGTPLGVINTAVTSLDENRKNIQQQFDSQSVSKNALQGFLDLSKESLDIVMSNLRHSIHLISSFKQIIVGEFSQTTSQFGVKSYLEDIQHILIPKFKNSQHQLIISSDESIVISAESGALSQVLINLINNSLIHAFDLNYNGTISLSAKLNEPLVTFTVEDNGKGIATDKQGKIFDKYFTTRLGEGGSGLGLYIVKNLVTNNLHGDINVSSTPGQGTKFIINIPKTS